MAGVVNDRHKGGFFSGGAAQSITASTENIAASALGELEDILLTNLAADDILVYDQASGKWTNELKKSTLDSLDDITIASISSGEILTWNGTEWVNSTLAEAGVASTSNIPTDNSQLANGAGYITDYTVTEADVTTHQAALSITESQISDLQSYLTAEVDTLQTTTNRGATTSNAVTITDVTASTSTNSGALVVDGGVGIGGRLNVSGDTVISGDLIVDGTTFTVNSNTVNIGDNIVVLNADEVGVPSQDGGITIERGTAANVSFIWDESLDRWSLEDQELGDVIIDAGSY